MRRSSGTERSLSRIKEYMGCIKKEKGLLEEKMKELKGLLEVKEKEIVRLNQNHADFKGMTEKKIDAQNKINADLRKKSDDLKNQLEKKKSELSKPNTEELNLLKGKINQLSDTTASLRNANASLERQLSKREGAKTELEAKFKEVKEALVRLSDHNDKLRKKTADLTEQLENKEQERLNIIEELKGDGPKGNSAESSVLLDKVTQERNELLMTQESLLEQSAQLTVMNIYLKDKFSEIFRELESWGAEEQPDKFQINALRKRIEVILKVVASDKTDLIPVR